MNEKSVSLLPLTDTPALSVSWFPSPAQCFIYRNWEMITPDRLAKVLSVSKDVILEMADALGLGAPASKALEEKWLTFGYTTLIRANWHLLPYGQLTTLLGWSEDALAFTLEHDDFLGIKLGRAKPNAEKLTVRVLTPEETEKTKKIAEITRQMRIALGVRTAEPFSFADFFPADIPPVEGADRVPVTLCLPYCALYEHVFEEEYFDYSFPDSLLKSYSAMGIRGIIAQAVLYTLIPTPFAPDLAVGYEKRLQGIRALVARLAKHNMKLYLYVNEPRDLPDSFFEKHPDWKGDVKLEGRASVCLSVPEVQEHFRKAFYDLTAAVPGLGGYMIITASENHTNCYSHKADGESTCPRCRNKSRAEVFANVIRLMEDGVHAADPSVKIIASTWAWDNSHDKTKECVRSVCDQLPKNTAVWAISERKAVRYIAGRRCEVNDYSISIPGPSEYSARVFRIAQNRGLQKAVKMQLNNSWELSSVPFIPVFHHFYENLRNMLTVISPDIVQLHWTMGGFPSPIFRMFAEMSRADEPIPTEEALLRKLYPKGDYEKMKTAFDCFDIAFDAFPFSVGTMYYGPQHMGPALPLYPTATGYEACMCGPCYDDLTKWRKNFLPEEFYDQFSMMADGFRRGLAILKEAFTETDAQSQLLLDCAEIAYLHFASSANHIRYVIDREEGKDTTNLIRQEEVLARREAEIVVRNPMIGFEATNHYFFTLSDLYEKVINCRHLLGEL